MAQFSNGYRVGEGSIVVPGDQGGEEEISLEELKGFYPAVGKRKRISNPPPPEKRRKVLNLFDEPSPPPERDGKEEAKDRGESYLEENEQEEEELEEEYEDDIEDHSSHYTPSVSMNMDEIERFVHLIDDYGKKDDDGNRTIQDKVKTRFNGFLDVLFTFHGERIKNLIPPPEEKDEGKKEASKKGKR